MGIKKTTNQKKKKMPGPLRAGIALLIFGAILVGLGSMLNRESLSLYGFVVVIFGFFLYFASSFYLGRLEKRSQKKN